MPNPNPDRDAGGYSQSTTTRDIIEAFEAFHDTHMTTPEVAEHCNCSPETARRRLRDLEDVNEVQSRTTGRITLWWRI